MASGRPITMTSSPSLELVNVGAESCLKIWSHGLPYPTVRWHFHPEYEIHLITTTSGRTFVGDYIGKFGPDNLVLLGPDVPHNWLSDVPPSAVVSERCLVLQFTDAFITGCVRLFPELGFLPAMLKAADRGLEFQTATGTAARPILRGMLATTGPRRLELFFSLLSMLHEAPAPRPLASAQHRPTPELYMREPLNHTIAQIAANPASDLREADLAALSGYTPSGFSRAFKRKTGTSFVRYLHGIRLNRACELLISGDAHVTEICFEVGFNNLANFNRQFRACKGMSPSEFRRRHRQNDGGLTAWPHGQPS